MPRKTREGYYIADIAHAGNKLHKALKAEPETAVRSRAEPARIQVPVELAGVYTQRLYFFQQYIIALLTLRAAMQVCSPPLNQVFKLLFLVGFGVAQYLYRLAVGQALKIVVGYKMQLLQQAHLLALVLRFLLLFIRQPFGQKSQIIGTVVKGKAHQVLDKLLGQRHIVIQVIECHLRLYHPELGQMP